MSELPKSYTAFDRSVEGAAAFDRTDELRSYRDRFHIPRKESGEPVVYLTGNSLGLQPDTAREAVNEVLDDWATFGVGGHFRAKHAWMPYHEYLTSATAAIVGAKHSEVVVMNSLTVNLHLLMASFYRPEGKRTKILIENHAFPSDRYAVRSHIEWHGLNADDELIIAGKSNNLDILPETKIESILEEFADEIALVLIGGVNYYSGQLFDMPRITRAAHAVGAKVGFDLAHGAGNVELKLHDWDVDFASWCSYKYLNAGPGGPSGVYIHERHSQSKMGRLAGRWGHDKSSRFEMPDAFEPISNAESWQMSNPPILSLAGLRASLMIFSEVGIASLRAKSLKLTAYLAHLIEHDLSEDIHIITPSNPSRRGAQLSLRVLPRSTSSPPDSPSRGRRIFEHLEAAGVICDWREPDIIRLAPVPLYNSFGDAWLFAEHLKKACTRIV